MSTATFVCRLLLLLITIVATSSAVAAQDVTSSTQEPAAAPQPRPTNRYVIRGCLTKSTLTDIEPLPPLKLPEKLRVTSTRIIRDQVKALSGHQVELTGPLFGVPGVAEGILISDSGTVRVYLGGADPNLGQDLVVNQNSPPTIRATMIKDVASGCTQR